MSVCGSGVITTAHSIYMSIVALQTSQRKLLTLSDDTEADTGTMELMGTHNSNFTTPLVIKGENIKKSQRKYREEVEINA